MKYSTPYQTEQLSLLSDEELATLKRHATPLSPAAVKAPLSKTREVRKARRSKGKAVQYKLPGL
jgi:hypothetical protein